MAWEMAMGQPSRLRLIEIGVAIVLTMAAFLFVALAVWAADPVGLHVSETWARATLGETKVTAAYMTIANGGPADDVLKSVTSGHAKQVQLHETRAGADGIMRMRPVKGGVPVPSGETVTLKPGGLHVMVMGLEKPLAEGGVLPLTLEFEEAGPVEIAVPVRKGPAGSGHH